jgi:predicted permease
MTLNLRWLHRLTALIRTRRLQQDLDDELLFHIEARTRDNIAQGMDPDEAALAARRLFGNRTLTTERMRDADVNRWFDAGLRNLRYAARVLRRHPGFAITVVLSMALGIGATTAVFTLLNAALLRTLPVKNPEQLITLEARVGTPDGNFAALGRLSDFAAFEASASSHVDLYVTTRTSTTTLIGDVTEQITVGLVTGSFYPVIGVTPAAGRLIGRADDVDSDANRVVVLDHEFWQRRFGGDPSVVGRTMILNNVTFAIVGITPARFTGVALAPPANVTIPLSAEARITEGYTFREVGGRLRPGVSREQASSVLTSVVKGRPNQRDTVIVARDNSRGQYDGRARFEQPLYVLMGTVMLLLLIAAANVASLLLARGAAQRREFSIRLAIGAGRGSIAAQVLTESVLIAALGGAFGVALAYWGAEAIVSMFSAGTAALPLDVRPDGRVLAFTTIVAALTGIAFGAFPAIQASRTQLNPALKEASGIVGRRPRLVARRALVIGQVALSLMLLSGAMLFARSLENLRTFDSGFARRNVLMAYFETDGRYTDERRHQLHRDLLERVRAIPGVLSAGVASTPVLSAGSYVMPLRIGGRPDDCRVQMTIASAGYLETMRIPLVSGRLFTDADNAPDAAPVIIINQKTARQCFGAANPIGQHVRAALTGTAEIVGVVADGKYRDLREDTLAMFYAPPRAFHPRGLALHVRTSFEPRAAIGAIRDALRAADPSVPLTDVRTIEEQTDRSVVQDRLLAFMSRLFGIAALTLAAVGLYGVVAFMAARRTNEIGLRLALGAQRAHIARLVLGESAWLLIAGGVLGVAGAYVARQSIQGLLFSVSASDWWSLAGATIVLFAVGVLASLIPARRAARIDPIAALRHE